MWQQFRKWPPAGQLAFALVVIVAGVLIVAALSNRSSHPATSNIASHTPASSTTTSTSPSPDPTVGAQTGSALLPLTIAPQARTHPYNRLAEFGGFADVDACRNTRAVVQIRTSAAPVTFSRSGCSVKTGRWTDPWSGVTTTVAHDFQIDHTVPLANAWWSGAWRWTHTQRVAYANDLADVLHLVPIVASENESKGDNGPDQWRPPLRSAWCTYARTWNRIKAKWHLSATQSEWNALKQMARTC